MYIVARILLDPAMQRETPKQTQDQQSKRETIFHRFLPLFHCVFDGWDISQGGEGEGVCCQLEKRMEEEK